MGVKGLYWYVKENKVYEFIDLVEEAKRNSGIEILIDFRAFKIYLVNVITKEIAEKYKNDFLKFPGGEFDIIHKAFYDFQKAFDRINIKLVWIIDGANGVDVDGSAQKNFTWEKRERKRILKYNELLTACTDKIPPLDLVRLEALCTYEVAIDALKKAGAEVIQLLQGESDDFIAYEFHRRKSFAIITNDSDFLVFENCKIIYTQMMSNYYNSDQNLPFINHSNSDQIFITPKEFFSPIINQKDIKNLFQFDKYDQLISLSILKGNSYTKKFAGELHYHLKMTNNRNNRARITDVANYIRKNKITMDNIYQIRFIKTFMDKRSEFETSMKFTDSFYSLRRINANFKKVIYNPKNFTSKQTDYLANKISNSEMSSEIYAIHFGTTRDKIYIESPNPSCESISTIMARMNNLIYPFILIESEHEVVEWRSRESRYIRVPVNHSEWKINDIKYNKKGILGDDTGLDWFKKIWSHLEPNGILDYFHEFGNKRGFICYILRYFYQITKNKNLDLSTKEFQALFVTVFYNYTISHGLTFKTELTRQTFLQLQICPTKKCLIINSWFLCIFHWAKYRCGGALNLEETFPQIQNLFSGSTFYAFYEYVMNETNERIDHLDNCLQDSLQSLFNIIMKRYDIEFQMITE